MPTASFQVLCTDAEEQTGVLRIHPDGGHWSKRSEYSWACTLRLMPPVAEIHGVTSAPSGQERRALKSFLLGRGITEAHYEIKGRLIVRRG